MDAVYAHDWKNDEGWQAKLKRFDFPEEISRQKKELFLTKKKRQYYKKFIDSDYVQGETKVPYPQKQPEPEPEPQPEPQPQQEQSKPEQEQSKPQQEQPQPDSPPQNQSTSSSSQTGNKSKKSTTTLKFLIYSYVFGHLFIVVCCILVMFTRVQFFYYAIYMTLAIRLSWLFYKNGRPQMNAMYAQRVLQSPDAMHALLALALMFCRPGFFGLISPLCHSVNFGFGQLNKLLKKKIPSLHSKVEFMFLPIIQRKGELTRFSPLMEAYYGVFLIAGWPFGMGGSFASIFLYWNFLRMKYVFSSETKGAFREVKAKVETYINRVPMLVPYWQKLCNFMYSYVDSVGMQQQYAQSQAGSGGITGMLSNLTSRCNIM